jgi:hypothetical protein
VGPLTTARIDPQTGTLLIAGKRLFPIGLSDPPPLNGTAPNSGLAAWEEVARAGVNFARNYTVWSAGAVAEQMPAVIQELDAAQQHDLHVWLALAGVDKDLTHEPLLTSIVDAVKDHPGLGAWKGADEPAHARLPAEGCVAVHTHVRSLDSNHPLVLIEAPRGPRPVPGKPDTRLTVAAVQPYAAACDIHGVDIYAVSRPPGLHAGGPPVNTDISVVGDMTRIVAEATPRKPIWTTLQIAWSGVLPPHPLVFPTLQQARFMAYDAIIAGARGLFFFGGHIGEAMNPADRARGWNWTYWQHVQRPLLEELTDTDHTQALTAPTATLPIKANAADIALSARETADFIYLIAARKSPTTTNTVRFQGLPNGISEGSVLAHPGGNPARNVSVAQGAFTDPSPYRPHNARVYRFPRPK